MRCYVKDPDSALDNSLDMGWSSSGLLTCVTGRYGWRWRKVKRLLKVVAPATAAMLSVGLQGAGLAHLPGDGSALWPLGLKLSCLSCHLSADTATVHRFVLASKPRLLPLSWLLFDQHKMRLPLSDCYVSLAASVSQMLTGSVIIFAAILSRLILKRRLNRWHYGGCASRLCMVPHGPSLHRSIAHESI